MIDLQCFRAFSNSIKAWNAEKIKEFYRFHSKGFVDVQKPISGSKVREKE